MSKNRLMPIIVGILLILTYFVSILAYSTRVTLLIVLSITLLISPAFGKRYIHFDNVCIIWLATLVVVIVSMLRTGVDQFYLLFYIAMIMMLLLSDESISWMSFAMNIAIAMGGIYAVFTIVQVVAGDFYLSWLYPLLQYNSTFDASRYMRFGIYSGLTYQTAINSLYLSLGIGGAFCSLLYEKKGRVWKIALIALYAVCIMLSAKRGHILFTAVGLLSIAYFSGSRGKRMRNILIAACMIFAVFVIAYSFVPAVSYFFDRVSDTGGDITNGRLILYQSAFKEFIKTPFWGIGWEHFRDIYIKYTDVHNIYLQLLCETGIIGTCVFIMAFIGNLNITIKKINYMVQNMIDSKEKYLILFGLFCQVFFLMYGFTGNPLYDYYVFAMYFLGSIISLKCPLERKDEVV